jgi:V/A-type H+-transporting ATPase subunit A
MTLLQQEAELEELVRLVGVDSLAADDRLLMHAARMIREDFLHQNAFDDRDTYTSLGKQYNLLSLILHYYDHARTALQGGASLDGLTKLAVLDEVARAKLIPEEARDQFDYLKERITGDIRVLLPHT